MIPFDKKKGEEKLQKITPISKSIIQLKEEDISNNFSIIDVDGRPRKAWSSYPLLEEKSKKSSPNLTPEMKRKMSLPSKIPLDLDPNCWQFHCTRVWSKSMKDLPVAIDLPRLAPSTMIVDSQHPDGASYIHSSLQYLEAMYDYESKNSIMSTGDVDISFKKHDILISLGSTIGPWTRAQLNSLSGVVPSSYVKPIVSPPIRKDRRTLEVLVTLASLLESQTKAKKIQELFYQYIPRAADPDDRDISRELNRFLHEVVGEETPTVRVLKACNQSIIAPAVTELTLNIQKQVPFKDGGGWRIRITVKEDEVCVTHWKKQKQQQADQGFFESFEWALTITFDKKAERILSYSFFLCGIEYKEGATEEQKQNLKNTLDEFFTNHGGTQKTTPPASFKEELDSSV